jgi:hypothetical protein
METINNTSPKDEVISSACELVDMQQGRINELETQQRVLFSIVFVAFLIVFTS